MIYLACRRELYLQEMEYSDAQHFQVTVSASSQLHMMLF